MKVTGYGPNCAPERLARVEPMLRDLALQVAFLGSFARPTDVILLGESATVERFAPLPDRQPGEGGGQYAAAVLGREALAAALDADGRADDARKVREGPPDAPQQGREGERLLVVDLDELVAVSWLLVRPPPFPWDVLAEGAGGGA